MKTRDRILLTSIELFNIEGEPNVTTVDIANEMDISPGNLYYHFKGKEQIIDELFSAFERELTEILAAPTEVALNTEDTWFYLYVVFEQLYANRWFYRNLNDLLMRYPSINKRFKRLLNLKTNSTLSLLILLNERDVIAMSPEAVARLGDNIVLNMTYWLNYLELRNADLPDQLLIHQSVFQLVSLVAPFFTSEYANFYEECNLLLQKFTREILEIK